MTLCFNCFKLITPSGLVVKEKMQASPRKHSRCSRHGKFWDQIVRHNTGILCSSRICQWTQKKTFKGHFQLGFFMFVLSRPIWKPHFIHLHAYICIFIKLDKDGNIYQWGIQATGKTTEQDDFHKCLWEKLVNPYG